VACTWRAGCRRSTSNFSAPMSSTTGSTPPPWRINEHPSHPHQTGLQDCARERAGHAMTPHRSAIGKRVARYPTVALVLQGGGALGGYQCGVYEGLHQAGIRPNWFAGISIGAINAAILAGNAPDDCVDRLSGFWELIAEPAGPLSALGTANR